MRFLYYLIFFLLYCGFYLLFLGFKQERLFRKLLKYTVSSIEVNERKRFVKNREQLARAERSYSFWNRMDRQLAYSGMRHRIPWMSAEILILVSIALGVGVFLLSMSFTRDILLSILAVMGLWGMEVGMLKIAKGISMKGVDRDLLKFLDFLGNYSITSGELTGIFGQISKYLGEPLRSTLEECVVEAQTTGDLSVALLAMEDKIEHPKFCELVRNMEISIRYCADFDLLVKSSRRSIREYQRIGMEKKTMLREAFINISILLAMSFLIFVTVDGLIERSMWDILFFTIPGKICIGILGFVLILFLGQIYKLEK